MPKNYSNNLTKPQKQCYFCVNNIKEIDYKNIQTLQRFASSHSKIIRRKRSGVCLKHQRKLAEAIKRARIMALMPFVPK